MFTRKPSIAVEKSTAITESLDTAGGPGSDPDNPSSVDKEESFSLPEEDGLAPVSAPPISVAVASTPRSNHSPVKRPLPEKPSGRNLKRVKSGSTALPASNTGKKTGQTGQTSIAGFFKLKAATASAAKPEPSLPDAAAVALNKAPPLASIPERPATPKQDGALRVQGVFDSPLSNTDEAEEQDTVHDPVESKESWAKLFTKPSAPLCAHGEPCKIMMSKKPGVNFKRWFYMCQKPLGPDGSKGDGKSEWRCGTFIWQKQQ